MNADKLELLRALPKVDLHLHLEGALRAETLWDFHRRQKQTLHGSLEALQSAYVLSDGSPHDFLHFLSRFAATRFRWGGVEALERVAGEVVSDAADDGVVHLELRFSPVFAARRMKDASATETIETVDEIETAAAAVVRGAQQEAARRGISVGFVVSLGRHFGVAVNRPSAELLTRRVGGELAGLDLAGDESFAATPFAEFFRDWKGQGRGVSVHAGEDPRGPGAANVHEAVCDFGADRIGHGVRAIEDAGLVAELARRQIALEMCPTSNLQTGACASLAEHPAKRLLEAGVRVTINTDDPAISGTTLSREYLRALDDCGLNWPQLRQCALNAAQAAFLPAGPKAALMARIERAWRKTAP